MKMYHLLPDQTVQPLPKGDHVLNFSDAEDAIDDAELQVRLFLVVTLPCVDGDQPIDPNNE